MNALLAEIEAKKAAIQLPANAAAGPSSAGPKKYMRRAEVEAAKEEEERVRKEAAREKLRKEKEERAAKKGGAPSTKQVESARNAAVTRIAGSPTPGTGSSALSATGTPEPDQAKDKEYQITPAETTRRLRARGHPVRLFGEDDKDRRARLRAIELGADDRGTGVKADAFWRTLKGVEAGLLERDAERAGAGKKRKAVDEAEGEGAEKDKEAKGEKEVKRGDDAIDMVAIKADLNKAYPLVYWAFKNIYKEWEDWMEARPDDIKRTTAGKVALATQVQSGVNMKPLFKQLRSRDMPPDLIYKLAELCHHVQQRQYQRANDAYLRLSIGNAAWPIGVTSVGLHERGAREKITEDVVAHVLNDEVSRKWIQAVKRLVTFSQMIRPPKDAAQAMG
ncbi:putative pre-mRNA splicing factor [Dioszegia hungarica]|uniref:Pre-mRNA-splicing factor 18 n=1 Tax=Dioszegia hungarica TaxID=4972 RepID=A0AA38LV51_9TREE|nr:putative pre-mRNA splicing factor [Dioszegia hungarica]KAI9636840.1 putative pre-mRNA splicing factor [Dioszegia hungarica]